MPKIDQIVLRCTNPDAQRDFYRDVLGMTLRADGALAYDAAEAGLVFEKATAPYQPAGDDTYWKIALAVPNINLAHDQLTAKGIDVGQPHQFQDIGNLAHFQDLEGFTIELIEHWFEGNRPAQTFDTTRLGGGASLNLLTLRSNAIAPLHDTLLSWGMTPLSVQSVANYGFTLHFYAFTQDTPPNPDLASVDNREWLYQRPYTVLEIQEVQDAPPMKASDASGYAHTILTGMTAPVNNDLLRIRTVAD